MSAAILMVEDDIATGEVLSDVLEDAGYDVTLASGGSQALQLLDQQPFAVVVSDIRMPAVSGIDVLQAARQTSAQPEVILLTGYGALETSLSALRQGAFDYLLKPCDPELLIQRVAEAISARDTRLRQVQAVQNIVHAFGDAPNQDEVLIERMPQPDSSEEEQDEQQVWQVGELSFGEAHHDASFRGEPLHLTPTEHTLLRAMASKPGKVFQYRELVYAMHGYDVSNIEAKILLKTHIRNIRHKIGPDYLVNVRSTGYKLVAPEEEPAC